MKLTWDEDDPERNQITRRALTRKEIEENDFRAYIASSSDDSETENASKAKTKAERDKLRALLLSGEDDTLPEGWGKDEEGGDTDMEITFTPGLSASKPDEEETTIEKYQRKMKEKKKQRKEELKETVQEGKADKAPKKGIEDDFFGDEGDSEEEEEEEEENGRKHRKNETIAEELALIAASDNPNGEAKHFDMYAVIKAEKSKGKTKGKKRRGEEQEQELQEDFTIDVKDDRFKAVHEDHTFAIDPSNPQ